MTSKIDIARKAFEDMKKDGMPFSKAAVAEAASVSKSLLSPDKEGNYKTESWGELAHDIAVFCARVGKASTYNRSKLEESRQARDAAIRKYEVQVGQNALLAIQAVEARSEVSAYKKSFEDAVKRGDHLDAQLKRLAGQIGHAEQPSNGIVVPFPQKIIISPEEELLSITGGEYIWNELDVRKAHTYAKEKLRDALSRPVEKKLYLTIGLPASGKSHWIGNHTQHFGKFAIYYDATNASRADRWELMELANGKSDTNTCFVFFEVPTEVCVERNRRRKKNISDQTIANFSIDVPSLDERFDELIIVR